jgi:uncharacterized membrane protein
VSAPVPSIAARSRIEGFSDAVFAFAVTLLVVSLEVPHTFEELWLAMHQFFAFAICFALLFQVWWRHFNFFRRYGLEDVPTIVLTGVLLFVVLFYVYPLKFVFTLVVNQIIGVPASHDGTGGPVIRNADTPRLMQIYSGGVVAVFSMFALMYANAFRQRARLGLDARQQLEARLNIIDNAGIALIGVASVLVATIGGPWAAGAIAAPLYFLIGPFKWVLGWYSAKAHKRIETLSTADSSLV